MTQHEIDAYLAGVEEPERSTLQTLRETIQRVVPDAEQGISYGLLAFRLNVKVIAGFGAFENHLTYVLHSGSVLPALAENLVSYTKTKSALHFAVDKPRPAELVTLRVGIEPRALWLNRERSIDPCRVR